MGIGDISRDVQLRILDLLGASYPLEVPFETSVRGRPRLELEGVSEAEFLANLEYLAGHGLVEVSKERAARPFHPPIWAKLSSEGIDFRLDDGGLGAILGVVTVRLHDDTIKSLLIDRIEKSDATRGVKDHVIGLIKQARDESLKLLVRKAVEEGIQNLPDAVRLVLELLSNA